jgi:hypothetical protein
MTAGTRERLDHLVDKHLTGRHHRNRWETRSVPGSTGARAYAWAWLGTADQTLDPVGAENPVTSRDLHVLVDEPTEPVSS